MSIDPGTMQLLTQQLQQTPQPGSFGGGGAGPQMQGAISPMNAAATIVQKVMLMRALQSQQQTQAARAMMPATNAQIANDPTMQALQASPQMQPIVPPDLPPAGALPIAGQS